MQITPAFETFIQKLYPDRVRGEGYSVELRMPHVLRYLENGRTLTFECEPGIVDMSLHVGRPVVWDNEHEPIPEAELKLIMSRIDAAFHKMKLRYVIFYYDASTD